jgi:hypothetical protein
MKNFTAFSFKHLTLLVFLSLLIFSSTSVAETTGEGDGEAETEKVATKTSTNVDIKVQRQAVKAWAKQLTEQDYNATHWALTFRHQPQNFFDHYIQLLSNIFKEKGAKVNFVLVGACDGTHDGTISQRYLPNDHWRGVFVEPFEINYKDLVSFMETQGVGERTYVLHAAATRQCQDSMIKMKRPTFEEKNKSLPHWMRRQIGSVVPLDKLDRPATGPWTFEMTRCVNGPEILKDWAKTMQKRFEAKLGQTGEDPLVVLENKEQTENEPEGNGYTTVSRIRPHILKVDVEGHDYEVRRELGISSIFTMLKLSVVSFLGVDGIFR